MLKARRGEDRAFPVLHIPPPPPVTPPPTDLQTALRYYSQLNKQTKKPCKKRLKIVCISTL